MQSCRLISAACFLLALAGCTSMVEGTQEAGRYAKADAQATSDKLTDLFTYHPKPPPAKKYIPPSYCYRYLMDIVCYSTPQAGAEDRLVAYQGSVREMPPPPVPEHEEPAAEPRAMVHEAPLKIPAPPTANAQLPDLKPVFVAPPPPVKAEDASIAAPR